LLTFAYLCKFVGLIISRVHKIGTAQGQFDFTNPVKQHAKNKNIIDLGDPQRPEPNVYTAEIPSAPTSALLARVTDDLESG
jgi:hypothetical protein